MLKLPRAFCWTRMGAESGQSLDVILKRKELERQAGNGTFFWGIGNSLGTAIIKFVNKEPKPKVLFSKIKSKPKKIDTSPAKVYLWKSFIDHHECIHELPINNLVLSRGYSTTRGKTHHYALVCNKENSFKREVWEDINFNNLKNYISDKNKLGFSQVTAIVKRNGHEGTNGLQYNVEFSASLVEPFFVKLVHPLEISLLTLDDLNMVVNYDNISRSDWESLSSGIHQQLEDKYNYKTLYTQYSLSFNNENEDEYTV